MTKARHVLRTPTSANKAAHKVHIGADYQFLLPPDWTKRDYLPQGWSQMIFVGEKLRAEW